MPKYGQTPWGIYMMKRGEIPDDFVPTSRTRAGQILEPAIARWVAEEMGARVIRLNEFHRSGSMGASYDYEVADPKHELHGWLVEIKNVDGLIFREQWEKDEAGRPVAPDQIVCQTQHQLEVSGRPGTILAPLVGGNDLKLIRIARDEEFGANLRTVCDTFKARIDAGVEPDVMHDDVDRLKSFYEVRKDEVFDATADATFSHKLASFYEYGKQIKELEIRRETLKAEVLQDIGGAAKVLGMDGYTVDAGITKATPDKEITPDMVGTTIKGRREFRRFTVRRKA